METINYSVVNGVGYVRLNRPDKANSFAAELKRDLLAVFKEIKADAQVRSVVVTGEGKFFSAGGDVTTMGNKQTAVEGRDRLLACAWLKELYTLEKPVIAAVNGPAVGGGFALALACDLIIASQAAKFGSGAIKIGLVFDMAALYFLPRRVGMGKAKLLAYTGQMVSAEEAGRIGIADMVVSKEQFDGEVQKVAEQLAQGPTYGIGMTKSIINKSFETDINALLDCEAACQAVAFLTADHQIALQAFFDKKTPVFTGK